MEELGVFPLSTSFENLKGAEFVSRDHSYADNSWNTLNSEPIAQCSGEFPPEVSAVDTEITRNAQEDEVEVEVRTTFLLYLPARCYIACRLS